MKHFDRTGDRAGRTGADTNKGDPTRTRGQVQEVSRYPPLMFEGVGSGVFESVTRAGLVLQISAKNKKGLMVGLLYHLTIK